MVRALSFAVILGLSMAAQAQSAVIVHSDSGAMPRCLEIPHSKNGVLFVWKDSSGYGRDVQAIALSQAIELWSSDDSLSRQSCDQWSSLLSNRAEAGDEGAQFETVTEKTESIFNVPLSQEVRDAIAEIRNGANVYHADKTGAEFLANNPVGDYDRDMNRALTRKYGQGFSGQVYKAWVEAKPENAAFKTQVVQRLESLEAGRATLEQTATKLGNYTLVMAPGFMQPVDQGRAAAMLADLSKLGIRVTVLNVSQMGSIDTNIGLLQSQLRPLLLKGKKLILLGLSKGMPEILTATTRLLKEPKVAASKGRVAGVLSLSGMFDGAFVVDWMHSFPQEIAASVILKTILYKQAKSMNITDKTLDGFNSMSSKSVESYTAENLQSLPLNIPVVCVIGVIPGDGTANDPSINELQNQFIKPYLGRTGGNDGYVEYPGTCLPRAQRGGNVSEIVFDASHVFLDGTFMGRDLSQTAGRSHTILSVIDTLLRQMK